MTPLLTGHRRRARDDGPALSSLFQKSAAEGRLGIFRRRHEPNPGDAGIIGEDGRRTDGGKVRSDRRGRLLIQALRH